MTPLEHALAYAGLGWRVAPIAPGTKYPRIDRWQQLATTDAATIRSWWGDTPNDGVSIVAGVQSGLVVIDIDPRHGGDEGWDDLEARYGHAPDTVESITGGGGRHLLFAMPDGVVITNAGTHLPPGIDVRGEGGQIVAPPSVHPETGRTYEWEVEHDPLDGTKVLPLPDWLLALLVRPPVEQQVRREPTPRGKSELPGDLFAAANTWPDLLEADGWSFHSRRCSHDTGEIYELWTRPGKTPREGASASLYYRGSDVLKVFTTDAHPLVANETYTKFGYFATMRHGGDMGAAARDARRMANAQQPSNEVAKPEPAGRRKARIIWNGRQLDDVSNEAVDALEAWNDPATMFVRAGQLARLREDEDGRPIIETLRQEHAVHALTAAADWYRSLKDGELTATPPPANVATNVLAAGTWPVPPLAGVVELPVLRPDGTFHVEHGYDHATRLYHWHRGPAYPDVADTPTCAELAHAVALVEEMLTDFPWDTSADRANAWALLLTPLVRPIVGQVPMALVDAPEPGTGKGLLMQIAATITIGRAAGLMAWPATDEELEKKVTAALMSGNTMLIFDNVEGIIKSPTLAAVLTADSWQGRVLGRSEMVMVPNRATWAATGNNIDVGGDLARRCYRIRLDARQAQPWKRTGFVHEDLLGWVASNRSALLHALCTIVRSWWVAGKASASSATSSMGGYTPWVRTIGGILAHAGVPDFLANLAAFHADADRDAQAWEAFLTVWSETYAEQPVTAAELIARMEDSQLGFHLRDVIPDELAGYWGTSGFSRRLGRALRRNTGRHYGDDGLHLVEMPKDRRQVAIYCVTSRSVQLFESGDGPRVIEKPAGADPVSRGDAATAGFAGFYSPTPSQEKLSTGEFYRGQRPEKTRETSQPALDPDTAYSELFGGS